MRLATQLVGLTCHLLTLVWMSSEYRLHPKQEKFVKQLSSYEIVTPLRVNDFGETFPHALHYRRKRRSLDATFPGLRAHYRVDAFGQRFHLNLTADSGFISPSYTVTHVGELDSNESFPQDVASDMRHCFFSGHVNAETEFKAIFSLCTGLVGTFTTRSGEYFLEPLMAAEGEEYDEGHNKPHLVYRHERKRRSSGPEGVLGNENVLHSSRGAGEEAEAAGGVPDAHLSGTGSSARSIHSQSRQKRFLSYPRYVELMVTADAKMTRHHGHNLENYILTIMSVVAAIYRDPSVGNLINITIVKLIVIHNEQDGPSISYNAASTLHSFCVWQQGQNVPDDNHPWHHDTALLITREDICRAKDKCDTLGLAELGTMCDPYRSCSISEENGLSASFTIAHELGHVFNMPHDDNPKCRDAGMKQQYHVMAPMLNDETSPWTWSKCSRKYITDFLDTGYGECLLDEPELSRSYHLPPQLPGQLYSANKQCELMFGPGSQVCPYMRQCKRLWCTSAGGNHKGCRTQHMPLADGSDCGHGMHCRHGLCVSKEADLRPLNGMWGPWGPYSACSRSCGGGTKSTVRDCSNPEPRNGGRFCVGRRMKFRSCSTDPCPRDRRDFREEQCAQFDGRHFNINGLLPSVRWLPKYSGILVKDRCKLFCRVAGKTAYYQLKDRVIDGTPCDPDTSDICVQGLCRQAGCDHVLNSKAKHDRCGVCGGDNSSCRAVSGTFDDAQYGYNIIVRIPAGATNIDITQVSYSGKPEDDNYLALSDSQSNFILNGNFVVAMFKREVTVKGAVIEYSGSDAVVERINCTDRIEEELVLQVLCVGNLYNPDVRYSYNIPVEERLEKFVWSTSGSWQDCSRVCQGMRRRKVMCIRKSDHQVASDQRCHQLPQPDPISEPCNTHCELRWHVAGRSECSVRCGPGHRTLDVQCVKYSRLAERSEWAEPVACGEMPKPPSREPCHGDCLLQGWHYSAWSQVRWGQLTRKYPPVIPPPAANRRTHTEKFKDTGIYSTFTRLSSFASVHPSICHPSSQGQPNAYWGPKDNLITIVVICHLPSPRREISYGSWFGILQCDMHCSGWAPNGNGLNGALFLQCTQSCGGGSRTRLVVCQGSSGQRLDERNCDEQQRPLDAELCNTQSCPGAASWLRHPWKPCSASCGRGTKQRDVACLDERQTEVPAERCAHQPRPRTQKACRAQRCPSWKANRWAVCSVSCGAGLQAREVYCRLRGTGRVQEDLCDPLTRPPSTQPCLSSGCPHHTWVVHEWQECNVTCGLGSTSREVLCIDQAGRSAHYSLCDLGSKPVQHQLCQREPCQYTWRTGDWSECSASCGPGIQQRMVICSKVHSSEDPPSHAVQPPLHPSCPRPHPGDTQPCLLAECPAFASWEVGPWSECSQSCGAGVRQRRVACLTGNALPARSCNPAEMPKPKAPCEVLTSCKEVQQKTSMKNDGEYYLRVSSRILQIYCAEMQSQVPKEYITLRSGQMDNFSEVYGYRLQNPFECPFNGSRRRDCVCSNDYPAAGYTIFHKVRLDLSAMRIITTDLRFSQTPLGHSVPFGTAGDCYSATKCPQGQFSINLTGTGLKIAEEAKWASRGNYATAKVHRSEDGVRIYGRCGGFCGKCVPQSQSGLPVQVR
uniref:ADAM metallopeptidase with thrombospondin type 1 motif 20 n=1 Tax=Paramormyrops kingsleyae TaxID=1676925 RepID=A0A3B3QM05_9TELE